MRGATRLGSGFTVKYDSANLDSRHFQTPQNRLQHVVPAKRRIFGVRDHALSTLFRGVVELF